ncbi:MAG: uroporphyrinogen decarboxylase family protein [Planctomycetota bacterium]
MNSKERIQRAIKFGNPDRIALNDEDMFVISGDSNWIVKKWRLDETDHIWRRGDIWGCIHRTANRDQPGYAVENNPLDDWDKLAAFQWPNPDTMTPFHQKRQAELQADPSLQTRYHLLDVDPGPLLVIINLMGFENFLVQCVENPEKVADLYRRISDYKFQLIKLAYDRLHCDGVVLFEDWGTQHGSLIAPAMFRKIFKPIVVEMAARIHALDMHYGIQGSGDLAGILDEYMDAGLDFLLEAQINSKRWDVLPKKIRGKLCLMASGDAQTTLMTGTPSDVREEVFRIKKEFATPEGGLVFLNWPNPGGMPMSKENQVAQREAMYEACGLPCPPDEKNS